MGRKKQTFTDPQTEEEINSTGWARGVCGLVNVFSGMVGLGGGLRESVLEIMLENGLMFGLFGGLIFGLGRTKEVARYGRFSRWLHDGIARAQHRRRQRLLCSQYPTHVPDGTHSRAQPSGDPQPAATAMLQTSTTTEKDRLGGEMEAKPGSLRKKQVFTDPQTGQEIESTWLAQMGVGLLFGLMAGLGCGLFLGLVLGLNPEVDPSLLVRLVVGTWMRFGLGVGGMLGLIYGLGYVWINKPDIVRKGALAQRIHDPIARYQHRRRQRILRSQEHREVPDGAISRAQPPGEPEPTDAALSLADDPDELERLMVSEDTAETTVEHTT